MVAPYVTRQRLYVDTMGFDPASTRIAIELLGAEYNLLGSDWPIMPIATRTYVEGILAKLDLSELNKEAILGGDTLCLLASRITRP